MPVATAIDRQLDMARRGALTRARFRTRLLGILGDCRFLWMAKLGDTTTSASLDAGVRTITWDATVAARLSKLGGGAGQTFASASTQYGSTPDTANLSFGNSTVDQAFSVVALANVTDTAGARCFVAKWDAVATAREWLFSVGATDLLTAQIFDEDTDVQCFRVSDSAITQGSYRLFGATYSGVGGASAANGITLYQDGAVIASTATNNASYASMVDTAAVPEIGAFSVHAAGLFDGSLALVAVCAGALTAAQHLAIKALCTRFYGVP